MVSLRFLPLPLPLPLGLLLWSSAPVALAAQPKTPTATARAATAASPQAGYDSSAFRALQWRLIGPFRGGRANAITGVTSQPFVYYVGYTGGGVWKTENAGASWRNISDTFFRTGSIGAIAVAESDPNVVYVGSGEHAVRGQSSSYGDGMYKSHRRRQDVDAHRARGDEADLGGARTPDEPRSRVRRRAGRSMEGHARPRHLPLAPTAGRRGRRSSKA